MSRGGTKTRGVREWRVESGEWRRKTGDWRLETSESTIHYSLFTIHYSLFTAHCSLFTIHYSLLTVHCSLFTVHCVPLPAYFKYIFTTDRHFCNIPLEWWFPEHGHNLRLFGLYLAGGTTLLLSIFKAIDRSHSWRFYGEIHKHLSKRCPGIHHFSSFVTDVCGHNSA